MKTIVFVMMVYAYGGNYVPSIEFKDMNTCMVAAQQIKAQMDANSKAMFGSMRLPVCVRIEK